MTMSSPILDHQQQQQQQSEQRRLCVTFCENVIDYPSPESCRDVPIEQKWYTNAELKVIRHDVAELLIRRIKNSRQNIKQDDGNDDPDLWGLERHSFERDHAKKAAIELILLAQHMKEIKGDPERLRSVSLQVSKNARQLAADQGFRDSCHVYYENSLETFVDDCISDFDTFTPNLMTVVTGTSVPCKRSPSVANLRPGEDDERRVRSRVVAA